jgi:uncharacterized membrane protein
MMTDRQHHTVRRLETFSDIVIAFTLSGLAFTLRLPARSQDLLAHPLHFIAFLASFTFVCALWWLHHRVFARLFYPNTLNVLLNFAFLASTVYIVFSLQLLTAFDDAISQAAYALSIGIAFCLLAVLFARGSAETQTQADDVERRDAGRTAWRVGLVGVAFLISAAIPIAGASPKYMSMIWIVAVAIPAILRARERLASRRAPAVQSEPTEPVRPES